MRWTEASQRLAGLALILASLGAQVGCCCGYIGRPPRTNKAVSSDEIVGTWRYYDSLITLNDDGSFDQTIAPGCPTTHGTWRLEGADLHMRGFKYRGLNPQDRCSIRSSSVDRFYLTTWSTKGVAPFGGDEDPDLWEVWRRVESDP